MESASFDYNRPLPPRNGALPSEWAAYRKITGRRLLLPKPVSIGKAVVASPKAIITAPVVLPPVERKLQTSRRYLNCVDSVFGVCANYYDIDVPCLKSVDRRNLACRRRHIAMYLAQKYTEKSLPEIGRRCGGRDHSTVFSGIQKIKRLLAEGDAVVTEEVAAIEARIDVEALPPPESEANRIRDAQIIAFYENGVPVSRIATRLWLGTNLVYRILRRSGHGPSFQSLSSEK